MHYTNRGFALTETILFLVIIGILGFTGWYVYNASVKDPYMSSFNTVQTSNVKKIVALGDMVCDPSDKNKDGKDPNSCQDKALSNLVKKIKPDAILALGDLQYEDGSLEKFQNSFDTNWGGFKKIIYPTPGNHEYKTLGASGYYSYFKDAPVDVAKGYYSFSLSGWQILSLNSNCEKIGGCGQDSEQLKWLEQELSNTSGSCTLAFWHHPRFTSGKYINDSDSKDRSKGMWQELANHKADIVLNGHEHLYERFALLDSAGQKQDSGIRQFTVGTGGKSHYVHSSTAPGSEKIIDDKFGVLVMQFYNKAYRWQFIDTNSQVLDSGYRQCNNL